MRILVTGGAGYIGSHAVLALKDAGWKVCVIDNLVTGFAGLIAFIWMIFLLLKQNWKNLRAQSKKTRAAIDVKRSKAPAPLRQTLSLALFSGFIALLIHSFFVNSLLFAQIMIPLWISIGLIQKDQ